MHISDGVLSVPVAAVTTVAAGALIAYSIKGIKEEDIPKVSLTTGAFFALSLIHIPVGPSSVHLMLGGLIGLILGRRSPIAFFIGLVLHLILFQHGGLSTLGLNTLLLAIPALFVTKIYSLLKTDLVFLKGVVVGAFTVAGTVFLLILALFISDARFGQGFFSVINLLVVGHIPLLIIEALVTGFAVKLLFTVRPNIFDRSIRSIHKGEKF